jgi:hypothetical protein
MPFSIVILMSYHCYDCGKAIIVLYRCISMYEHNVPWQKGVMESRETYKNAPSVCCHTTNLDDENKLSLTKNIFCSLAAA